MFPNKIIFDLVKKVIGKVKKNNHDDEKVATADASVFDNLLKKTKKVEEVEATRSRDDLYRDFYEKIKEAQKENEEDPEVETADPSVYEKMQQEIEMLKRKVEEKEAKGETITEGWDWMDDNDTSHYENSNRGTHAPEPVTYSNNVPEVSQNRPTGLHVGNMAVTNSNGGSITLRMAPEMGAAQNVVRVPDQSLLKILEVSDKMINLDGKNARWVHVDYNGNRGWILESYLNFN